MLHLTLYYFTSFFWLVRQPTNTRQRQKKQQQVPAPKKKTQLLKSNQLNRRSRSIRLAYQNIIIISLKKEGRERETDYTPSPSLPLPLQNTKNNNNHSGKHDATTHAGPCPLSLSLGQKKNHLIRNTWRLPSALVYPLASLSRSTSSFSSSLFLPHHYAESFQSARARTHLHQEHTSLCFTFSPCLPTLRLVSSRAQTLPEPLQRRRCWAIN